MPLRPARTIFAPGRLGAFLARADHWAPSREERQRPSADSWAAGRRSMHAEVQRSLRRLSTLARPGIGVRVSWGPSRTRGPSPGATLTAAGCTIDRGRRPKGGGLFHRGTRDRRRHRRSSVRGAPAAEGASCVDRGVCAAQTGSNHLGAWEAWGLSSTGRRLGPVPG